VQTMGSLDNNKIIVQVVPLMMLIYACGRCHRDDDYGQHCSSQVDYSKV
jgi:hypothetical protein